MNKLMTCITLYGPSLKAICDQNMWGLWRGSDWQSAQRIDTNAYVCPLCTRRVLIREHDEYLRQSEFTWDHYPPKSVGGISEVLVCRPCNSDFGKDIDYSLKAYLQYIRFIGKEDGVPYPIKARFEGIQGSYLFQAYWKNQTLIQTANFKKYPLVHSWFNDKSRPGAHIHYQFTAPPASDIQRALLKTAYLICFENWGYEFVFSHTGYKMRGAMLGTEEHPLSNYGVFGDLGRDSELSGIFFLKSWLN